MATINVSGSSQLLSALKNAKAGDVLSLAGGNYGSITIPSSVAGNGGLTIKSASESNQAVFKSLDAKNVSNFTINNVKFDDIGGANAKSGGLTISNSTNVKVLNSDFTDYKIGSFIYKVTGLTVDNNTFTRMYHDAMNFTGITNGVISNNVYTESNSQDGYTHKDFIQFWTNQTYDQRASSNIQILNNKFYSTDGDTHGIFMNNEWHGQKYQNITISNNYLKSSQTHGISLNYGDTVKISNNTLIKDGPNYPVINVTPDSTKVQILSNTAPSVPDQGNSTWVVANNKETGGTNYHWTAGLSGSPVKNTGTPTGATGSATATATAVATETTTTATTTTSASSSADEFRFDGTKIKGIATHTISDLDFSGGDTIVLIGYDAGTFGDSDGDNLVWNNSTGTYVKVDSLTDIQELVTYSDAITADTSGDTLYLTIDQASGEQTIAIAGLGSEYLSTYDQTLF